MKTIVRIVGAVAASSFRLGSRRAIPHEAGEDRSSVPARRRHRHRRRLIAQKNVGAARAAVITSRTLAGAAGNSAWPMPRVRR